MERVSFEARNCSLARSLDVLGDWWNVLIVREALWGATKFDDFQRNLGMSKSILSKRLKLLLEHEVLQKQNRGGSVDYYLTAKGQEINTIIMGMLQWGDRWYPHTEGPPVVLINKKTGSPLAHVKFCDQDGQEVSLEDIGVCAGPGANAETRERIRLVHLKRAMD
ncbi:winged helix-turn-helix transcriptional regulator [Pseudomonas benzenivorans]|uniref:Helix-turn-helix transcriptional regulator n=1 Tax=Pseudomonas benzenivorans TaxID=556533 RepID=A0ABY5H352_9PSED|nr:helix-turn-helix domain-containing protein [Pseudomonas benzenivorans]UTW05899.1 helix-turn-helix transcriptional regulator [Pseudomonas benzenivorans]